MIVSPQRKRMVLNLEKLEDMQEKIASKVDTSKSIDLQKIKKIAGFDCAFFGSQAVCAAVVFDANTMTILEKKYVVAEAQMPYIAGFLAFREGPLILQLYYDLENEPDVLMIDGHGIAHPKKCGLATYVGIELGKPTIGVAKNLLIGEVKDSQIFVGNEPCGSVLITKEHAKPLFISPGNLIDIESSATLAKKLVIPPHKLPEPIHASHRFAKKTIAKLNGGEYIDDETEQCEESEQEKLEREFGVNSGSIV